MLVSILWSSASHVSIVWLKGWHHFAFHSQKLSCLNLVSSLKSNATTAAAEEEKDINVLKRKRKERERERCIIQSHQKNRKLDAGDTPTFPLNQPTHPLYARPYPFSLFVIVFFLAHLILPHRMELEYITMSYSLLNSISRWLCLHPTVLRYLVKYSFNAHPTGKER